MADVSRRRCSNALKSSCGFGVLGVGDGLGTEPRTPAGAGAGITSALGGVRFSWAALGADGFATDVTGLEFLAADGGFGFSGLVGCDSTGGVPSTEGSVAVAVGGTGADAAAGGAEGGDTEGTDGCSDRLAPGCAQAVKPMIDIIARQAHSCIGPVYPLGSSSIRIHRQHSFACTGCCNANAISPAHYPYGQSRMVSNRRGLPIKRTSFVNIHDTTS
jgi:hypothetical protein